MADPVSSPVGPRIIQRLSEAVYPAMAMRAAMQLDLFSSLAHGPKTKEEIAAAIGVNPVKLAPLSGLTRSRCRQKCSSSWGCSFGVELDAVDGAVLIGSVRWWLMPGRFALLAFLFLVSHPREVVESKW
jgi:hypothetical protein